MTKQPEPLIWLSDARGIYIPRDFAQSFAARAKNVSGVTDEEWEILEAGPDHELYWDAWSDVEQKATVTDDDGHVYNVYQDGDVWLIPDGMEWDEEHDFWRWPEPEPDPDDAREQRNERRAYDREHPIDD
jgi:hypothetical protein